MPELQHQIAIPDSVTADFQVCRALLRRGRVYEDAVKTFAPYTEVQDPNPEARESMRALIGRAREEKQILFLYREQPAGGKCADDDTFGDRTMIPTERSRLRRLPKRGSHEPEDIYRILDAAFLAHLGFQVDGQPFVIPTLFGRDGGKLYLHGSAASRTMREVSGGIPACVTVTLVDGLVLARSAFHHSMNYRSVVAFGTARRIEDPTAKNLALGPSPSIDRRPLGRCPRPVRERVEGHRGDRVHHRRSLREGAHRPAAG